MSKKQKQESKCTKKGKLKKRETSERAHSPSFPLAQEYYEKAIEQFDLQSPLQRSEDTIPEADSDIASSEMSDEFPLALWLEQLVLTTPSPDAASLLQAYFSCQVKTGPADPDLRSSPKKKCRCNSCTMGYAQKPGLSYAAAKSPRSLPLCIYA